MLYSHNQLYKHICIWNQNDTIKTSDTVLRKIYLSLCLKGLCVRSWRRNRTATNWPHHSYGHQPFFPVLQSCSTGDPGAQLSAGCWLSLPHLVSQFSDLQTTRSGVPRAPFAGCWLSLPHLVSNCSNFMCTQLYNSSIAHSISPYNWPSECVTSAVFGMACLIVIKRK